MTVTIDEVDLIHLPGWGYVTGEVILSPGYAGDRWSPPEAPAVEGGTLTTEDGDHVLDVEELVEDDDMHTLLMDQIATLPRWRDY